MRLGWTRNEARVDLEWALKKGGIRLHHEAVT